VHNALQAPSPRTPASAPPTPPASAKSASAKGLEAARREQEELRAQVAYELARVERQPRSVVCYPDHAGAAMVARKVPWTGGSLLPVAAQWVPPPLQRAYERNLNYPALLQGALLLALAPYNLAATSDGVTVGDACARSAWLVDRALRHPLSILQPSGLPVLGDRARRHEARTVVSPRVCCTLSWRPSWVPSWLQLKDPMARGVLRRLRGQVPQPTTRPAGDGLVTVAFRGTKELGDLFTDLDALPASCGGGAHCHRGFLKAFDSVRTDMDKVLDEALPTGGRVLITGHSLGGALAQVAAVHVARRSTPERPLRPVLVTFAAPAIGDSSFVHQVRTAAAPLGGLRVYNDGDPIPALSTAVGYRHAGVPLRLRLSKDALDAYHSVAQRDQGFFAIAPHVLFHVGSTVYGLWTPRPHRHIEEGGSVAPGSGGQTPGGSSRGAQGGGLLSGSAGGRGGSGPDAGTGGGALNSLQASAHALLPAAVPALLGGAYPRSRKWLRGSRGGGGLPRP